MAHVPFLMVEHCWYVCACSSWPRVAWESVVPFLQHLARRFVTRGYRRGLPCGLWRTCPGCRLQGAAASAAPAMPSRLWERGKEPNGFASSSHSWNQGGWTNDKSELKKPNTANDSDQQQPSPSSAPLSGTITADELANPSLSSHESPPLHGIARRPRIPRSESAVKDGRKFLAAFREKRRNQGNSPASAVRFSSGKHADKVTIDSLQVPRGLADAFSQRLERYQSCAPGLARSLEAALDASLRGQQHSKAANSATENEEEEAGDEQNVGGDNQHGTTPNHPHQQQSTSDVDSSGGGELRNDSGTMEGLGGVQHGDDSAAASPGAADAAEETSPKTDNGGSSSPEKPTPEMLRQAARTSQAAFLSSVLPAEDFEADNGYLLPHSPPITPKPVQWSSAIDAIPKSRRESSCGVSAAGGAVDASSAISSSAADMEAVAQWASLKRLHDQSVGLGSASVHQLSRALELCRALRGLKAGVGNNGGKISAHERASWLDALQSSLHGLEEVLSKRSLVDRAARREADALGGPAVVSSMLDLNGGEPTHASTATTVLEGGDPAKTPPAESGSDRARMGWLSGAQLKAFEAQVQARSSMEIAALESERRKLRSKVEMFQRQVLLLQPNGAVHSPAAPTRVGTPNGGGVGAGAGAGGDDALRLVEEKRFDDLLNARLGEERHLQATFKAEVTSLRDRLEEKDGLIDALREALRSTAKPGQTVDDGSAIDSESSTEQPVAEDVSLSHAAFHGRAVPGRPVFARRDGGSRGRYHYRSSRLLGASGPVAMAEAEAAATVIAVRRADAPGRGAWSESTHTGTSVCDDDQGGDDVRPGPAEDVGLLRRTSSVENGAGAELEAAVEGSETHASDSSASSGGDIAAPAGVDDPSSAPLLDEKTLEETGAGDGGIVYRAKAASGTALRSLRNSAWVVGSRVGLDGNREASGVRPQRSSSSHAVMIM